MFSSSYCEWFPTKLGYHTCFTAEWFDVILILMWLQRAVYVCLCDAVVVRSQVSNVGTSEITRNLVAR